MSIREKIHDDLTKDEIISAQELEIEELRAYIKKLEDAIEVSNDAWNYIKQLKYKNNKG